MSMNPSVVECLLLVNETRVLAAKDLNPVQSLPSQSVKVATK